MLRCAASATLCLLCYLALIIPFTTYLRNKPVVEKLGYVPSVSAFKTLAADHKELVAASIVIKALMYFGGLVETSENRVAVPPDYMTMSRYMHGAVKLDPYNMDAYYFAQSFLSWDVKQYKMANDLLDYGMKYRTWDWYLPFFAGFNSAYFLHDYSKAAEYYKRSAELSGFELHIALAGRYLQKSGQTELAINYLTIMAKGERNPATRKTYLLRLKAFKEVRRIENAQNEYQQRHGAKPVSVEQLVAAGFLSPLPKDPYGGKFYFEADGSVATTSKFAFIGVNKNGMEKAGEIDESN